MKTIDGDFKLILKNDIDEIKELSLPMVLLIDNSLETIIENSEEECTSSSCNNESQNFCDCGSEYEDFEIYDIQFADLEKWKSTAKELSTALEKLIRQTDDGFVKEDIKNGISQDEWELNLLKALNESKFALENYKKLTENK